MNPLLQIKLRFQGEKSKQRPGGRNLKKAGQTSVDTIDKLLEDLRGILRYYHAIPRLVNGIFIDVNYNDIIAKSNRIHELLKPSGKSTNDIVVGARFTDSPAGTEKHIITYYVTESIVTETLKKLDVAYQFLVEKLDGSATDANFRDPDCKIDYSGYDLAKTRLRDVIIDCSVIESFAVPQISQIPESDSFLLTFYQSELPVTTILEKLRIDETKFIHSTCGRNTLSVTKELFLLLQEKIPYMISMVSSDFSRITLNAIADSVERNERTIPDPNNEPVIGVIDMLFDTNVYFSKWVENVDYLDEIEKTLTNEFDREHGTEVSSIIVDGPILNSWLDDKCGRFRVRHFGVCTTSITVTRLVRKIKEIVTANQDIHVWNLSLGTEEEVSKNFISFDAALLDELQSQYNVVFVVSGTNDNRTDKNGTLRIGSPADSLNSIVVNAIRRDGTPTTYSRKGNVLSFFNKPDVSYYGGDYDERIIAYSPVSGDIDVYGTSFAAPWISRKLCYLIDIIGMPREVAKALLIDSAAGWEFKTTNHISSDMVGYGGVPIDINTITSTENDEIRFILHGTAESYITSNYSIPVPRDEDDKYPYVARATLCYFPECSRSQGVDYTTRELSFRFGRINNKNHIDDINDNTQDDDEAHITERKSRNEFRKWENTKFISRRVNNNHPIKSYDERLWGISITSKERLGSRMRRGLTFGTVITLKEIKGVNRIDDFVRACTLRGWIVNELNVQNRIELFNTIQEELHFE